jgi:hypothetical protein
VPESEGVEAEFDGEAEAGYRYADAELVRG